MTVKDKVLDILKKNQGNPISGEFMAEEIGVSRAGVWKAINALRESGYRISASTNRGYILQKSDVLSSSAVLAELAAPAFESAPAGNVGVQGAQGEPALHAAQVEQDNSGAHGGSSYPAAPTFESAPTGNVGVQGAQFRLAPYAQRLHVLNTVDSTNEELKRLVISGIPAGTTVLADEQTAGKGRLGRGFHSPKSAGIYLSYLMKPRCDLSKALLITAGAAVACARAIRFVTGVAPGIKWVNDIYMSTSGNYEYKKVAGILTEAITDFESGQIDSVIIGIGINCSGAPDNFPADIRNSAGSIEYIAEKSFDRNLLAAVMIRELDDITNLDFDSDIIRKELISEYKEYSVVIDRDIFIYKRPYGGRGPGLDDEGNTIPGIPAHVSDITDDGGLQVEYSNGSTEVFTTSEITLRI